MAIPNSGEPKRCILYARVSTEEQTEKFGLSSQLSELRQYAQKMNYNVIRELADEGFSGADLGRPALTTLRDLVRSKNVSIIVVHDPDRLARKLALQLVLTDEFERAGARLEFVTTPAADNMEGRLLLNVRGVIAEYEREKIRERTMRGRREKARQGLIVGGRRPYGYQAVQGNYEIDSEEAEIVRSIFKSLVQDGLSIRQIVERLNREGHPPHTAKRWAKSTVGRILRNEMYIGRTFYNRRIRVEPEGPSHGFRRNKKTRHLWRAESEWIAQAVPVVISVELFQAAQIKLKQNSAHCSGRPSKNVYLLRGILKCPACGRKYAGVPVFGDLYYRCLGRERLAEPRCSSPMIPAKIIEPFVWEYIIRLLSNPNLLAAKLAEQGKDEHDLEQELANAERHIREIRKKEDRLLEALLDEEIALPGLRTKAKELEGARLRAQQRYEEIQTRIASVHDQTQMRETAFRYCQVLGNSVSTLEVVARQKLLRALLDDVIVDDGKVSLKGILPTSLQFDNRPQREHIVISRGGNF
jgi:site-specific DNA recombinase